jgi:hypothetical protein
MPHFNAERCGALNAAASYFRTQFMYFRHNICTIAKVIPVNNDISYRRRLFDKKINETGYERSQTFQTKNNDLIYNNLTAKKVVVT